MKGASMKDEMRAGQVRPGANHTYTRMSLKAVCEFACLGGCPIRVLLHEKEEALQLQRDSMFLVVESRRRHLRTQHAK